MSEFSWSRGGESNSRPAVYDTAALPTELPRLLRISTWYKYYKRYMTRRILGAVLVLAGIMVMAIQIWLKSPFSGEKRYLILLQNQMELRPTGGFLGSYAVAKVKNGKLVDVSVQDIYEPDGRVTEYVEPPEPIQEAFQLGTLRLRDANWDPDFPKTAKTLMWYFKKAGEGEFDGVIATNLLVFQGALRLVGPIKLIDYGEEVTADKLWEKAQFYSQERFFPGSKQKREFLKDLAKGLLMKMGDAGLFQKLKLLNLAVKMANEKQIMIYSNEGGFQKFLETVGWGGEVRQRNCPAWLVNCVADSLMIVEANLGVNKANCCVERKARLEMKKNENGWDHKLTLIYENHSGDSAWGGKYKAWVRLIIPSSAGGEKGFWVEVPEGEESEYAVEYVLPGGNNPIFLSIQKQSGIQEWPLELIIDENGKKSVKQFSIRQDVSLQVR